jgi:hypothetical protein
MDKPKWSADASEGDDQMDLSNTAESVRSDFDQLIAVFDRHLASLSDSDGQARSHILEAKAAAERGCELGDKLIGLLRTPG